MKVYLAALHHKNGVNLYAGADHAELLSKLASYCREQPLADWCGSVLPSKERLESMTDLEVVEAYFQDHPSEYVEEDSDEISEQVWFVTPGNPTRARRSTWEGSMAEELSTHKSWWSKVTIKEELRSFTILSNADISQLTREAAASADPVAYLNEELEKRATSKKAARENVDAARMEEDADRINAVDRWPNSHLPLKTQPWVTNKEGKMRFALIHCSDLLTVIEEGKAPVTFDSVAEIVKTWSVD